MHRDGRTSAGHANEPGNPVDRLVRPFLIARRNGRTPVLAIVVGLATWTCAERPPPPAEESTPEFILGEFVDDYGIRYTIRADEWVQHPDARYHLRAWHSRDQFIIAQNDSGNTSDAGLWTRIDWIVLDDSDEYEWAFCYAAYRAPTREDAVMATPTQRDTPRTGCNGFPFSRMRRVVPLER